MIELFKYSHKYVYNARKEHIRNAIVILVDKIELCMGGMPKDHITKLEIKDYSESLIDTISIVDILEVEDIVDEVNKESITNKPVLSVPIPRETVYVSKGFNCCIPMNKNKTLEMSEEFEGIPELCKSLTLTENTEIINFEENVTVLQSDPIVIPESSLTENGEIRYGSNWPSKVVLSYSVRRNLSKIRVKFVADDHGWGNTGHCNVRYQINSEDIGVMAFLYHNKYDANKYSYTIMGPLKPADKITIYLVCAPWEGFTANIKDISFQLFE